MMEVEQITYAYHRMYSNFSSFSIQYVREPELSSLTEVRSSTEAAMSFQVSNSTIAT